MVTDVSIIVASVVLPPHSEKILSSVHYIAVCDLQSRRSIVAVKLHGVCVRLQPCDYYVGCELMRASPIHLALFWQVGHFI